VSSLAFGRFHRAFDGMHRWATQHWWMLAEWALHAAELRLRLRTAGSRRHRAVRHPRPWRSAGGLPSAPARGCPARRRAQAPAHAGAFPRGGLEDQRRRHLQRAQLCPRARQPVVMIDSDPRGWTPCRGGGGAKSGEGRLSEVSPGRHTHHSSSTQWAAPL